MGIKFPYKEKTKDNANKLLIMKEFKMITLEEYNERMEKLKNK